MSENSRPPRGPRKPGFAGPRSGPSNGGRNRTDSKAPRNGGAFVAKGSRSNSDRTKRSDNGGYNPASSDRIDNYSIDSSARSDRARPERKDSRRDGAGSNRSSERPQNRFGAKAEGGRFGNRPEGGRPDNGRFGDRREGRPESRTGGRAEGRSEGRSGERFGGNRQDSSPRTQGGRFGDRPERGSFGERPAGKPMQARFGDRPDRGLDRGSDRGTRPERSFGEDRGGFNRDRAPLGQRPAKGPARGTDRARDRGFGISSEGFPGRTEGRPALPAHLRIGGGRRKPRAEVVQKAPGTGDRIAKLLARAGVGSRRDIERMITEGRIALNGNVLETPATILTSLEGVTVDDRPVADVQSTRVYVFHKPSGVITAARDPSGRPTIYDVLPKDLPRLMPVGRLDLSTEGLLLMTNDGELKRALELPSSGVPRTYRVRALGEVRQQDLEALALGVTIDGVRYGSVDASVDRRARADGANIWLTMTLTEGKNREVRRLCEGMGLKVSRLIRTSYGPFSLGELGVREIAEANPQMVIDLKAMLRKNAREYAKEHGREDD